MALVGVALETLVFEPGAQTTRPPTRYCFDLIGAVKCVAVGFQKYEYTLIEIFLTCGTQLGTITGKHFSLDLVNKPVLP